MKASLVALVISALMLPAAMAGPFSPRPDAERPTAFMPIQSRSCTACRRDCARQRDYCHGHGCQAEFIECMRFCWYDICRR